MRIVANVLGDCGWERRKGGWWLSVQSINGSATLAEEC